MSLADQFPVITKRDAPLAPFTHLRIGGPAEFLVQPRSVDELNAVLSTCQRDKVKVRMLGGGYNLLIQDDPVPGVVIRLTAEPFTFLKRDGMGGGDIKLAAMFGALLGPIGAFVTITIAAFVGALAGAWLMARGRGGMRTELPFGTCLAPAAMLVFLWGQPLVQGYLSLVRR